MHLQTSLVIVGAALSLSMLVSCGNTPGGNDGGADGGVTDPRCSKANCAAMVNSCHADIGGVPTAACNNVELAPVGFDWSPYCVDACNQQALGAAVACIGSAAGECADGGNVARQAVINRCRPLYPRRDAGCVDACDTQQKACNDHCTGGSACRNCRNGGLPNCTQVCPDGGFQGCVDCSTACGRTFGSCWLACPLEP